MALAGVWAALAHRARKRALPRHLSRSVVLAGVGAVGGWFALMIPAFAALFVLGVSALGLLTAGNILAFVVLLAVAGLVNTWRCVRALARRPGVGPSALTRRNVPKRP